MPNIWSGSTEENGLCAALTNPTGLAARKGKLRSHYPVTFREGEFIDSEGAYKWYQQGRGPTPHNLSLMIDVLEAKLRQHPRLVEAVDRRGGEAWLAECSHRVTGGPWEGDGLESPFIACLVEAYRRVTGPGETACDGAG